MEELGKLLAQAATVMDSQYAVRFPRFLYQALVSWREVSAPQIRDLPELREKASHLPNSEVTQ